MDVDGNELPADGSGIAAQTTYLKKYDEEALKLFRVAILDKRRKMHLLNEGEVSKRWTFEEGVSERWRGQRV